MKRTCTILFAMLVVIGLAALTMASQISQTKDVSPLSPNIYHVGDTIHYVLTTGNPVGNAATNTLTDIHDHLPNGTDVYFIDPNVDPPLIQAPGDSNMFTLDYVVAAPDIVFSIGARRVINQYHASGFDSLEDNVTATVERNSRIITPCIHVEKTVDPNVAIAGQDVTYTVQICNCGDTDLTLTDVNDNVGGVFTDWLSYVPADGLVLTGGVYDGNGVLQPGECTSFQVPYTIDPCDPDPLCDTVCATGVDQLGGPAGTVTDCDPACVDLLQPDIDIQKSCPAYSKVGDIITYDVCITNIGDTSLQILSVDDDVAGPQSSCVGNILAPDSNCCFSYNYTVQAGDPDPLINTVSVVATVVGTDVNVSDSTMCETELVEPNLTVTKDCLTEPVSGAEAQFRITIANTGDANLIITTNEPELPGPNALPIGATIVFDVNRVVPADATTVDNTVDVNATLAAEYGLPNVLHRSASASCTVPGGAEGCTPGFWKNNPDCWCADYQPTDKLNTVFTFPAIGAYLGNYTLMQALNFKGGSTLGAKAQILLRAAVSALLNSCSDDVDYPLSTGAVIAAVNEALASLDATTILNLATLLDDYNNYGCPISSQNAKNPCSPN